MLLDILSNLRMNHTSQAVRVHGSPCHRAALAKNALVLVSEFGCPHVFLTLTCNQKWPEIVSQLLDGQTAFDHPEVTATVFNSLTAIGAHERQLFIELLW
jgi:hypothetical protein